MGRLISSHYSLQLDFGWGYRKSMLCSPLNENINASILKDYFLKIPTGRQGILSPVKEQSIAKKIVGSKPKKSLCLMWKRYFPFSHDLKKSQTRTEQNSTYIHVVKATRSGQNSEPFCLFLEPPEPGSFQCIETIDNKDTKTKKSMLTSNTFHLFLIINEYKQECLGWGQQDFITSDHVRAWLMVFFTQKEQVHTLGLLQREKQKWNICGRNSAQQ